ncbi:MAG: M20/M25/M40 family metallo-hydrolase [Holosporales bacterium]|jgi:succinyl-diaminopimelate desuccinylase|nr:M20/M25/M40 family metallo-hydrolase [Holosporales bacterium]
MDIIKELSQVIKISCTSDAIRLFDAMFRKINFSTEILSFNGVDNLYAFRSSALANRASALVSRTSAPVNSAFESEACASASEAHASALVNRTLLFLGHADVVPVGAGWTRRQGYLADGCVWGRGAVDMKGAIVCFIEALKRNPEGNVAVIISGDEEGTAEFGTPAVLAHLQSERRMPHVDFALIGEPTSSSYIGDSVKVGCRGSLNVSATAHGSAGHVAYPQFTKNAATAVIQFLNHVDAHMRTVHAGDCHLEITSVVADSGATNVVPAIARGGFNIRFTKHTSAEQLEAEITQIAGQYCGVEVAYEVACRPFECGFDGEGQGGWPKEGQGGCLYGSNGDRVALNENMNDLANEYSVGLANENNNGLLAKLVASVRAATGKYPSITTTGANSDAKFVRAISSFAELGLRYKTAHQVDEHVAVSDLYELIEIYAKFLSDFFINTGY